MIRTKGEAGTGDVSEAVKHIKKIRGEIKELQESLGDDEQFIEQKAKEFRVSTDLLKKVLEDGKLPVVNFAAGGVASPADAALLMQLGCEGVFVGSGIFKSNNPEKLARAIVEATTHYNDTEVLLKVSSDLGDLMGGLTIESLEKNNNSKRLANIGW